MLDSHIRHPIENSRLETFVVEAICVGTLGIPRLLNFFVYFGCFSFLTNFCMSM